MTVPFPPEVRGEGEARSPLGAGAGGGEDAHGEEGGEEGCRQEEGNPGGFAD